MSRTLKDKPYEVRFSQPSWPYYDLPSGSISKKKRHARPQYSCCATPSWWVHMFMTKKRRAENRRYEAILKQVPLGLIEEYEPFLNWKRPHIYYW